LAEVCQTSSEGHQGPIVELHQQLVDISHLARQAYDKLIAYQSVFQQAYLSEHQKLLQNVAAYNKLSLENERLMHENRYCKEQLLPEYDRVLSRQAQELQVKEEKILDVEAKNLAIEEKARGEEEESRRMIDSTVQVLQEQNEKIKELENIRKTLSEDGTKKRSRDDNDINAPGTVKQARKRQQKSR
jgi:hypothetical protein